MNTTSFVIMADPLVAFIGLVLKKHPRGPGVVDIESLDRSYKSNIKKFLRYVHNEFGVPTGEDKWTSVANLESYFRNVVQELTCEPAVARKHLLALKKLKEFEDNLLEVVDMETVSIKASLKEQKAS